MFWPQDVEWSVALSTTRLSATANVGHRGESIGWKIRPSMRVGLGTCAGSGKADVTLIRVDRMSWAAAIAIG
jgi:hypothetical protein